MPVVLPFLSQDVPSEVSRRIWIGDNDLEGNPVNPALREAAYQKEEHLFRYRRRDLPDDAHVAELIEKAVYTASKAAHKIPVKNAAAYLFRTYQNLINEEIATSVRLVPRAARSVEHSAGGDDPSARILDKIEGRRVLEAMDESTRQVWERRLFGYQVQEIAEELNISADCLSTRLRRGAKEALSRLRGESCR